MSTPTIATGQTRQRGEAIAAAIAAHPPFNELAAAGIFTAQWNASRNLKAGITAKLSAAMTAKTAKLGGLLVTISPFEGNNGNPKSAAVVNDTTFLVSMWQRMMTKPEDSLLPDPLDLVDELQRLLASIEFTYPDDGRRIPAEKVRVLGWEEAPDATYLLYQITIASRVVLGKPGT